MSARTRYLTITFEVDDDEELLTDDDLFEVGEWIVARSEPSALTVESIVISNAGRAAT